MKVSVNFRGRVISIFPAAGGVRFQGGVRLIRGEGTPY